VAAVGDEVFYHRPGRRLPDDAALHGIGELEKGEAHGWDESY
jgi:hypothetical protein